MFQAQVGAFGPVQSLCGPSSVRFKKYVVPASKITQSELSRLMGLAKPEARTLAIAVGLLVVSSAVTMAVPFSMGRIIDIIFAETQGGSHQRLVEYTQLLIGVFLVGAAANYGRIVMIQNAGQSIVARLRQNLFSSIMRQDVAFFDRNQTGEVINRLAADTVVVGKAVTDNVSDGLRSVASAVVGIGMMAFMSPKLTLVVLGIVPPVCIVAVLYGRYVKRLTRQVQDSLANATQVAEERISNIRTVRAFAKEPEEVKRYDGHVQTVYSLGIQEGKARGIFHGATGLAGNLMMVSLLWYGGHMMVTNEITVGTLTSFLLYSAYVGVAVIGLSQFYSELMRGLGASERLWTILDSKPTIPLSEGHKIPHDRFFGKIDFQNVAFAYPTRPDAPVFKNLSLTVPDGKILAVVGTSGGGKSTVGALLLRLYDPDSGNILIDNYNVRELDASWMRQQIGLVSQEPVLFSGTVAENIAYGHPSATIEQIQDAAVQANAHRFITEFPEGFNTIVGERGQSLSGGQRQRIAIARALLKNPRILILDEATSALDAQSEHLVQEALERLMQGRSVITIAHRLSTIRNADTIAVLGNGEVVESGTYAELMALPDGQFRKLVERQTISAN
ncbi:ATP-binding cassette sub-family B member 10 [Capsaspora owczarzaki ATCC 30864]|nr:ATP-binding cassette sub-family B member 10 [Capsaspora owczarzaki ATCC 30864]|eukprot:XP_004365108.2 ATP-binding cassette sub-family B member 10 [Capsaspora owczarzaki ATCC 30864]